MASGTEGATEHAQGMPQLDFSTFPNQVFWLVLAMLAIYFILNRVALPRIAGVLADRQGTIQRDLDQAEEMRMKAQEAEAAYEKALADAKAQAAEIVAEAKAEIAGEVADATAKADAEIAAKASEAEKAIAEIRASAAKSIEDVASLTANDVIKAVLGSSADSKKIATAVKAQMKG
ncbi:MAG: F0F1 ATP synthase subunit B' [Pseudomonadota bacterium]